MNACPYCNGRGVRPVKQQSKPRETRGNAALRWPAYGAAVMAAIRAGTLPVSPYFGGPAYDVVTGFAPASMHPRGGLDAWEQSQLVFDSTGVRGIVLLNDDNPVWLRWPPAHGATVWAFGQSRERQDRIAKALIDCGVEVVRMLGGIECPRRYEAA